MNELLPIFSLLTFVVKNVDAFKSNSPIHSTNNRQSFDLHLPTTNLTKVQRVVLIKTFNNLPLSIKQLSHDTDKFKLALKSFF